MVRNQAEEDVGIDMEVELSNPDPCGHFLKVQVKGFRGEAVPKPVRLKNDFLRYAYECRIPIALVLIETGSRRSWFFWVQGCIETNRLQGAIYGSSTHSSIAASWLSALDENGSGELQKIARGIHPISLVANIRDLIRIALETRNPGLAGMANQLLVRHRGVSAYLPVDLILDEVLAIGPRIWATEEGNALLELLYPLAHSYGDRFTREQVRRLVLREDTYSRTGINTLGITYEKFPEHMKSLRLVELFEGHADNRVAYFCKLREKYPGVAVPDLMSGRYDCAIDGLDIHPSARDNAVNAWANRGDCAILDYVCEMEEQSAPPSGDIEPAVPPESVKGAAGERER
jgi:Domain of unknown function (DUF4365)